MKAIIIIHIIHACTHAVKITYIKVHTVHEAVHKVQQRIIECFFQLAVYGASFSQFNHSAVFLF